MGAGGQDTLGGTRGFIDGYDDATDYHHSSAASWGWWLVWPRPVVLISTRRGRDCILSAEAHSCPRRIEHSVLKRRVFFGRRLEFWARKCLAIVCNVPTDVRRLIQSNCTPRA